MPTDPLIEQLVDQFGIDAILAAKTDPVKFQQLVAEITPILKQVPRKQRGLLPERIQSALDCYTIQPAALEHALKTCIESPALIAPEQEKLRYLLTLTTNEIERDYIEYQIDLVEKQLTRAAQSAERRLAYYHSITDWEAEEAKCKSDIFHWFDQWAWTLDPREDSPLNVIPFELFPFQRDTVKWLDNLTWIRRSDGVVEKSRDQGWTWISTGWSTYYWKYKANFQVLFGSKNEDAVDSMEEPDTILEKVRFQIRLLPVQMLPKEFDHKKHMGWMKIVNPENGAVISGEAPTANFGRSGRYSAIFLDEHSSWPYNGRPQWTAASASAKTKISASTPQGTLTKQAELAKSTTIPKITLKWTLHPWKDQRWYDGQTLSMDEQEIAQEIDIDYEASQPGPIFAKLWDKQYHIITWSQFKAVFGVAHKPLLWPCVIYQDVGTSPDHPTATGWFTRPTASDARFALNVKGVTYTYDLTDTTILYRSMVVFDEEIGDIWNRMCELMRPQQERQSLKTYKMSHEAESERKTLRKNGAQPSPISWKPGKTRGIAEAKRSLKLIDEDKPNPFNPELMGRPTFLIVVADDQYDEAVDDFGMARFRAEIAAYHFPKQTLGEPVKAQTPYAFFNDCMDFFRIAAADGFAPSTPLTDAELREQQLRPELRMPAIAEETNSDILQAKITSRDLYLKRAAAAQQVTHHRIMAAPRVRFRR